MAKYRLPAFDVTVEADNEDQAEGQLIHAADDVENGAKLEKTEIQDGDAVYYPWTDGYAVGYKVEHGDGTVRYIYLNPSNTEDDEGHHNVFLYIGNNGDPALDGPEHFYEVFEQ